MKKKLFILYGGPSSERAVSFNTKDFFYGLYKSQEPVLVEWLEDFTFAFPNNPEVEEVAIKEEKFYKLLKKRSSLVIIAGHGEYMEDGYIQEKFEEKSIAFTGSNSVSCAVTMDKEKSQRIASKSVKTIPTYVAFPSKFKYKRFTKKIGNNFPIFIKPNKLGSSIGAHVIETKDVLLSKLKELEDIEYLFQPYLKGKEVSIGSIRIRENKFIKLPLTEIIPTRSGFFDYNEKYSEKGAKEITPGKIDKETYKKIRRAANNVHNALGLGFYSRSDFIVVNYDEVYYLETNPLPGMSKTSILPQQLRHAKKVNLFRNELLNFAIKPHESLS